MITRIEIHGFGNGTSAKGLCGTSEIVAEKTYNILHRAGYCIEIECVESTVKQPEEQDRQKKDKPYLNVCDEDPVLGAKIIMLLWEGLEQKYTVNFVAVNMSIQAIEV